MLPRCPVRSVTQVPGCTGGRPDRAAKKDVWFLALGAIQPTSLPGRTYVSEHRDKEAFLHIKGSRAFSCSYPRYGS